MGDDLGGLFTHIRIDARVLVIEEVGVVLKRACRISQTFDTFPAQNLVLRGQVGLLRGPLAGDVIMRQILTIAL